MTRHVFEPDEMQSRQVDPNWTPEILLKQEGIFFLKDIVEILDLNQPMLKKEIARIKKSGKDPYSITGVRKVWQHWMVRMKVFAPYYRQYLVLPFNRLPKDWDANTLLSQSEGIYLLTDICTIIPFTTYQIRYQAKKLNDSKKVMGVWKDKTFKLFFVDLAYFNPWLRRIWSSGFTNR